MSCMTKIQDKQYYQCNTVANGPEARASETSIMPPDECGMSYSMDSLEDDYTIVRPARRISESPPCIDNCSNMDCFCTSNSKTIRNLKSVKHDIPMRHPRWALGSDYTAMQALHHRALNDSGQVIEPGIDVMSTQWNGSKVELCCW